MRMEKIIRKLHRDHQDYALARTYEQSQSPVMHAPVRGERTYIGGCHCGRVRFELQGILDRATDCNCSICTPKAYLHHMVPSAKFRLVCGAADLSSYAFGTHVAQHLFCRVCGVAAFF